MEKLWTQMPFLSLKDRVIKMDQVFACLAYLNLFAKTAKMKNTNSWHNM